MSDLYFLREMSKKDVSVINDWRNDRTIVSSLGAPFRYIDISIDERWAEHYYSNRFGMVRLSICDKKTDVAVGVVYLLNIDWVARNCEFAIMIGDVNHQGRGIGEYATRLAVQHAFNDLNLHRIYLTLLEENTRAFKLYSKVGFKKEGLLRDAVFKNGQYLNLIQMSLITGEPCVE
ncbi:GNAT family N-acetyltransferase [Vibrio cholerae]|nr:GNAT family N-acetyltransferase [Vibrio cholerae]